MIRRVLPLMFLLGGCSSLDNVIGGIGNAPDWFQQRRVEIRGEGYPSFRDVPKNVSETQQRARLTLSEAEALAALELFKSNLRSQPPEMTVDDISAVAADIRKAVEKPMPMVDPILTPEEVEALRQATNPVPVS